MSDFKRIFSSVTVKWQAVLFLAAFLIYGNTVLNSYSFDDALVTTEENTQIMGGLSSLPEIFTTHYLIWNNYKADYRPLVKASFALEYQFFGLNPSVSHFINVLLFALVLVLVFGFIKNTFPKVNQHLIVLVVLLFAAHPINTEVVASLKNRDELFSFLFVLLSFQSAFTWVKEERRASLLAMVVYFLLSLFSKMSSVTWFPVLLAAFWYQRFSFVKTGKVAALLIGLIAFYYAAVFGLMDSWGRDFVFIEVPYFELNSASAKWASIIASAGYYLKLLVYPYPLCCYYGFDQIPISNWADWTVYASILAYSGLIYLSVRGLFKRDMLGLGATIILCDLVLFVNVLYPYTGIIGERVLFGSTLGIAMVFIGLVTSGQTISESSRSIPLVRSAPVLSAFILSLIFFGSGISIARNADWKTNLSLFSKDASNCNRSAKLQQLHAHFLRDEYLNDPARFSEESAEKVIEAYKNSIAIYDKWPIPYYGLGNVWFFDLDNAEKAIPYYERALQLNPNYADAGYDLLDAYLATNEWENAVKLMYRLIETHPQDETLYNRVVSDLFVGGAINLFEEVNANYLAAFPNSEIALIHQGNLFLSKGDTAQALSYFDRSIEIKPDYIEFVAYVSSLRTQFEQGH